MGMDHYQNLTEVPFQILGQIEMIVDTTGTPNLIETVVD